MGSKKKADAATLSCIALIEKASWAAGKLPVPAFLIRKQQPGNANTELIRLLGKEEHQVHEVRTWASPPSPENSVISSTSQYMFGFHVLFAGLAVNCFSLSSSFSRCCSRSSSSFCLFCWSLRALLWNEKPEKECDFPEAVELDLTGQQQWYPVVISPEVFQKTPPTQKNTHQVGFAT